MNGTSKQEQRLLPKMHGNSEPEAHPLA